MDDAQKLKRIADLAARKARILAQHKRTRDDVTRAKLLAQAAKLDVEIAKLQK